MAITDEIVREQAREIILSHAKDVEYLSIGEMIADFDEFSSLPEDEFDRVQGRIDKQIRNATVTVSWPDEQPQDEQDETVPDDLWWSFTGGMDTCFSEHDGEYRECCWRAGLAYVLKLHEQQVRAEQPQDDGDVRAVAALRDAFRAGGRGWGEADALIARFAGCIAALEARDAKAAARERVTELGEFAEEER